MEGFLFFLILHGLFVSSGVQEVAALSFTDFSFFVIAPIL